MECLIIPLLAATVVVPPIWLLKWGYENVYLKMSLPHRRDFLMGFFGIIVINALLVGVLHFGSLWVEASAMFIPAWMQWVIPLSPWVINGGLLILALLFRPKVATGVFSLIGLLVAWGALSSTLLVASCTVILTIGYVISQFVNWP